MDKRIAAILILAVMSIVAALAGDASVPPHWTRALDATCIITTSKADAGTAWAACAERDGRTLLFTAAHVALDLISDATAKVRFVDGEEYTVHVESIDSRTDVAILSIPAHKLGIPLKNERLAVGDAVSIFGCLGGQLPIGRWGRIASAPRFLKPEIEPEYLVDIACAGGDSGAALLDAGGYAVGMINLGMEGISIAGAVPAEALVNTLQAFLSRTPR